MGSSKALYGNRCAGNGDKQAKPAEASSVRSIPPIPRHPIIGESEQEVKRRPFDARGVRSRSERKIDCDCKGEGPDKNVDYRDLSVADFFQYPQPVEKQDGTNPKERKPY